MQDLKWDLLGLEVSRFGTGPRDGDYLAGSGRVRGFDCGPIDRDFTLDDKPLEGAPGYLRKLRVQESVQSRGSEGLLNGQGFGGSVGHLDSLGVGVGTRGWFRRTAQKAIPASSIKPLMAWPGVNTPCSGADVME